MPDRLLSNLFSIIFLMAGTNTSCAHNGRKQGSLTSIFILQELDKEGKNGYLGHFWTFGTFLDILRIFGCCGCFGYIEFFGVLWVIFG